MCLCSPCTASQNWGRAYDITDLSAIMGLSLASVSHRYDIARRKIPADQRLTQACGRIVEQYESTIRTRIVPGAMIC